MEFPAFKSQAQAYQNPNPLADNIRYVLAKKKIDVCLLSSSLTIEGTFLEMGGITSNPGNNSKTF